jgi:hypothetical protein
MSEIVGHHVEDPKPGPTLATPKWWLVAFGCLAMSHFPENVMPQSRRFCRGKTVEPYKNNMIRIAYMTMSRTGRLQMA